MKDLFAICILLFISEYFFAQQDEVIRDTIFAGKVFHIVMYNEDMHVACFGNYLPHTYIRNGEWDYFYDDGKISSKTFFKLDRKVGNWVYYNEQGHKFKKAKKQKKANNEEALIASVFYEDAQQNKNVFNKQFENVRTYSTAMLNYSFNRYINIGRRHRHFTN